MKKILLTLIVLFFGLTIFISSTEAKNCVKGKQCGNTCIAMSYTCHVGTYDEPTPSYTYPSTNYSPIPVIPSYQTPTMTTTGTTTSGSVTTGYLLSGSSVDTGAVAKAKLDAKIKTTTDKYLLNNSKRPLSYHKRSVKSYYKMYLKQTDNDKKYILKGIIDRITKTFDLVNPIE